MEIQLPLRLGAMMVWVLVLQWQAVLAQTPMVPPSVPPLGPLQATNADLPIAVPDLVNGEQKQSTWLDSGHRALHGMLWRSAMSVDRWMGGNMPAYSYADQTRGSITPVLLWDEHNGFDEKLRFRVKIPLPSVGKRFGAFIGTFTRDEFVTEREQPSGPIPHRRGNRLDDDETLIGIQYHDWRDPDRREVRGGSFEADAGVRIKSPVDPFVKAGYQYVLEARNGLRTVFRETVFWQQSEQFGVTSRIDLEHMLGGYWFARWSTSATISEKSEGVRGFVAATFYRYLAERRSIGAQLFTTAELDADVPLEEFGLRVAYRQRIARDWLVLEVRPSVTWPKDDPGDPRKPSWGLGIGIEMFFGHDEFQGRPVTF